jgi:L-iditol 2-dehydrogenase
MHAPGAYAEYVTWPAENLFVLPEGLSLEVGALAEPLAIAIHAVGRAHLRPRDTAFIAGAGTIGLLTLAVLKQANAGLIAVSDVSDHRLQVAHELGAQVTINPQNEEPRAVIEALTGGEGVDVAFEAVGRGATAQQTIEAARNRGTVVWIGNNQRLIDIDMQSVVTRELTLLGTYGMTDREFQRSLDMLASGVVPTAQIINRRATLDEGPALFDELLATPETIKCLINIP